MNTDSTPDPFAIIDGFERLAEVLRGAVAVLVADGWTDDQARAIVLHTLRQAQR